MPKQIYHLVPRGRCPKCGHTQFIVREITSTLYLTDRDGKVCDFKDEFTTTVGMCTNCNATFDMYPAYDTFIPLTPLMKLLPEYSKASLDQTNNLERFTTPALPNPIEKKVVKDAGKK